MRRIMHRSIVLWMMSLLFTFLASPALATPYLISYEADTPGSFPEDEGWRRSTSRSPGATRTVQDGVFTLASTDPGVTDSYFWDRPSELDPGPGELFFAEWRVLVLEVSHEALGDPGLSIASNQATLQGFTHSLDRVINNNTFDIYFVEPDVFHIFRLESPDMSVFRLYVDGMLAFVGEMRDSLNRDFVAFGDATSTSSTSSWDYVRFGVTVIPEPRFGTGSVLLYVMFLARRKPRW